MTNRSFLTTLFAAALAAPMLLWTGAAGAQSASQSLEPAFESVARPFFKKNCFQCHNADNQVSGVRVDHLDAAMDDKHLKLWEAILHRVSDGTMPPKGMPQPSAAERAAMVEFVNRALNVARSRPTPKNGLVRRLTISQYRNTLRELLRLEDDLTESLPPDAVSKDGFVNNKETLQLNPLLTESYFNIAEEALTRSIVDPKSKPEIQSFRVGLGAAINPAPFPEDLILGANSTLLENKDFLVSELTPAKPFAYTPKPMRTKYRFIEGYAGNATVRGWRDYSSIYHSVFACMRGKGGYPKGHAYSTVQGGLLLRPAIPSDELFGSDGTYGPRANFKISLRELPDNGRFRVTVTAAKYIDGLMLDKDAAAQPAGTPGAVVVRNPQDKQTVTVPQAGIYQVDLFNSDQSTRKIPVDTSRLGESLGTHLNFEDKPTASPFGKAATFEKADDALELPRDSGMNVGDGDFTVAAWIKPKGLRKAGLLSLGATGWGHGWYLEMPDNRGIVRFESAGPDGQSNGSAGTPPGTIKNNTWSHVAVVIKRGKFEGRIFVNGYPVGRGEVYNANLDNPKMNLRIGRLPGAEQFFRGDMDEVRIYRRALGDAEIQGLVEPGRQFAKAPPERPQEVKIELGGREFSGPLPGNAFVTVRLPAGPLQTKAETTSLIRGLDRMVLTPLAATSDLAKQFTAFEKRNPRLGVHLGFRRDCGSTFAAVDTVKTVSSDKPAKFVFEGAIRNYPSPNVESDNVNYLAGVREIAVRSEYTDGRDMPRLMIQSVEFEGPFYDSWPPPSHKAIYTAAQPQEILRNFATRAYRRPVTAAELKALVAVYDKSKASGRTETDSLKDALLVVLTSPQFLFLIENSQTPGAEALTPHELSAKLSYFLWNSPPDTRLQQAAAAGTLRTQLDAEVNRMIADSRFSRFIGEFTHQWLSLDKFQVLEPDRKKYPDLTRDARAELKKEPIEFVRHLIQSNLPVRNLIASDFIMANEVVASYYGLGAKTDSGLQFVPLTHGRRELGGVLTQAALMAGLSDGRESNPIKRGAWVARKIVAEPPADPPPNVPALKEDSKNLTLRQRLEQHRSQPGCRQCHTTIDPWGVALEEFDAGGRLKSHPVDARSTLPDKTEVSGIDGLRKYLAEDRIDQVAFSFAKHLAIYANGRSLTYNETNFLKQDVKRLKASGYRAKDLVKYVVSSKLFLEK